MSYSWNENIPSFSIWVVENASLQSGHRKWVATLFLEDVAEPCKDVFFPCIQSDCPEPSAS